MSQRDPFGRSIFYLFLLGGMTICLGQPFAFGQQRTTLPDRIGDVRPVDPPPRSEVDPAASTSSPSTSSAAKVDESGTAPTEDDGLRPTSTPEDFESVGVEPLDIGELQAASGEAVVAAPISKYLEFEAPFTIETIDAVDFEEQLYRTTPDALRDIPGIMVQKTSHGQGSPFIRGFTGFRNLFLVDGIRLNNSVFREGPVQYWATVDPYSLQGLRVVKGTASVLYGSDSVGGTVNAITKSPSTYREGFGQTGRMLFRYASGERSLTGRGEYGMTIDHTFGLHLGVTGKHFGDLEGGQEIGRQVETGYDEWDLDLKSEYYFTPDTKLIFAHQQVRQNNVPRTHSTIFAKSFSGSSVGSDLQRDLDQERDLTYLQLHTANLDGPIQSAKVSLSWHQQNDTQDRIRSSGRRDVANREAGSLGLTAQLQSESPIGLLTYGFDYYHDAVNSSEIRQSPGMPPVELIQGPVGDDASYDLLGLFIQDEIPITKAFDVILGGRFTYAAAEADQVADPDTGNTISLEDDWSDVIGSARAVYRIIPDRLNIFAGVAQAFRAPNLSDLTSSISSGTNTREIPALGLDPEQFLQFEVGAKYGDENLNLFGSYYYTDIQDVITRSPTGDVTSSGETIISRTNSGDGYVHGVELGVNWRVLPQLTAFATGSWTEGYVDTFLDIDDPSSQVRAPADRIQPLTGRVGLRVDDANKKWWFQGDVLMADRQDQLSPRDESDTQRIPPGGTPGYQVFNLRAGWRAHRYLTLTAAVENIFDEDYRVHGSGTNEVGRNFVLAAEISF